MSRVRPCPQEQVRNTGIRKVLDNPFVNLFIGIVLWLTSSSKHLFWSEMMSFEMNVNHGVALLGLWRVAKYLPDVIDKILKD